MLVKNEDKHMYCANVKLGAFDMLFSTSLFLIQIFVTFVVLGSSQCGFHRNFIIRETFFSH